jgi:hypothetical protein
MRLLLFALLLANVAYFAWSQQLLIGLGMAPATQREPQRVAQQVAPDALRLLSATEFQSVQEQASKQCLLAGPLEAAQLDTLRLALEAALPPGSWVFETVTQSARWVVYLGKFANPQALAKKRAELAALGMRTEPLSNPDLEPGLSLGTFDSQAQAQAHMAQLAQRGLRTARVLREREPVQTQQLRLAALPSSLLTQLGPVRQALGETELQACP